jgi:cysteinylglycine-S-conjugate dipeptidase
MQRFTEMLAHLVGLAPTPSNPAGRQAVREYMIGWLIRLGFDITEHGDDPTSQVVIASRGGKGLRLGLCGHYDVEEAGDGWSTPPFELTLQGGRLLGRGVADNLGPLVLRLLVLETLGRDTPTAPLLWVLQGEEETGSPVAHALYPTLPWPQIDLWIEETGYFERDGAQRFLARDLDAAGQRVVDALEIVARQTGRGFTIHPRYLNKAFGESCCPFLTHLVRGRPYVALGPNDPDSRIHHIGESLAPDNIRFAMAQFEILLTAAMNAQTQTPTQI